MKCSENYTLCTVYIFYVVPSNSVYILFKNLTLKPRKVKQKQIKRKIKAKPGNGTLNQGSKEVQVLGEKTNN